jgi:hypothetical protein
VYEIGPGLEREGTVESDVFDAGSHTLWGRVSFEASLNGGSVSVATRSGNLDQPQKGWSAWMAGAADPKGARVGSPAARFIQWKATLHGDGAKSPELDSVDVAYLPKNVEPRVDEIETTPANYRFPPSITQLAVLTPTLVLPPIGRRGTGSGISIDSTPAMQWAKGYIGVRWAASDPNGDALVFTVEIKGANENEWKPLKEKVSEKYLTWDSTAFPDGEYRVRVTASDAPGNAPSEALSARGESAPFWIDNTPPRITGLSASRAGGRLQVKWHAADALNNARGVLGVTRVHRRGGGVAGAREGLAEWFFETHPRMRNETECRRLLAAMTEAQAVQIRYCLPKQRPKYLSGMSNRNGRGVPWADVYLRSGFYCEFRPAKPKEHKNGQTKAQVMAASGYGLYFARRAASDRGRAADARRSAPETKVFMPSRCLP